jgi:hypothetical protein
MSTYLCFCSAFAMYANSLDQRIEYRRTSTGPRVFEISKDTGSILRVTVLKSLF